jgi:hypothetical protein
MAQPDRRCQSSRVESESTDRKERDYGIGMFQFVYPSGLTDTVLHAKFDFQWQLGYEVEEPIRIPKGTKMIVTAHHDNSANNSEFFLRPEIQTETLPLFERIRS